MKKGLEIILKTVHVGSARRVVTLTMDGHSPADEFITSLSKSALASLKKLKNRIRVAAEFDHYANTENFKSLKEGLYEFKVSKPANRLYAFYDDLCGQGPQFIIVTSGGGKGGQTADITYARQLHRKYLAAIAHPDTEVTIKEI